MISHRSTAITVSGSAEPLLSSVQRLELSAPSIPISRSIADLRVRLRKERLPHFTIGLVPTMGALHDGHLSLIRSARRQCDVVVVSVFVNPTQFDEQADLAAYPRQEQRDAELAWQAGADLLFAPPPEEIYKPGFATFVEVQGLTDRLEGAVRGQAHFRGVTTIVCKLLNVVEPDVAFFGQKDAQQAAVIKRMVADLDIDVEVETLRTVREPDGLAMSSRNARLRPQERRQAISLYQALSAAERLADGGERSGARLLAAAHEVLDAHDVQPEYLELVDHESLQPLAELQDVGLLLLAARIGQTRLIDNVLLRAPGDADREAEHRSKLSKTPRKET